MKFFEFLCMICKPNFQEFNFAHPAVDNEFKIYLEVVFYQSFLNIVKN